ncbi:MAG: glycosyltransferase [Acidimicrobiia bacterium]|nr:glycosyltransferase [Acidimicrobiia bacterium]
MTESGVGHRLVLDVQALQSPHHAERGIGRYVAEHAASLLAAGAPVSALVLDPLLPVPMADVAGLADSGLFAWNTPEVVRAASHDGPVAYHVMSPFEDARPVDGVVTPHGVLGADALVVTLYDAIPFVMAAEYQRGWWSRQFLRRRARLVATADLVLAISESTARDAVEVLGVECSRVRVIGGAAASFFRAEEPGDGTDEILAASIPALHRPFVMSVSGDDPRKDPETLIDAFALMPRDLRREHQLVIACTLTPEAAGKWRRHAHDRGLGEDDVVLTGYVSDAALRALYRRTSLFAFTSRYEGFGLPVLEAARCGAPVITASSSSLPEILDCPESTFPPGAPDECAALMEAALQGDALRAVLREAGERAAARHTWAAVADRTISALSSLDPGTSPAAAALQRRRRGRIELRRVALVGPFPPARSGVADYNSRVAAALAAGTDLTAFSEEPPTRATPAEGFRRLPAGALGRTFSPAAFDHLLYVLGNSHHHRRTFALALRYPGVVWLHDASLAGLYLTAAGLYLPGIDPETIDFDGARVEMRSAVERNAGPDAADLGEDWWRPEAYVRAGLTMTEEVLRGARAVIVSTESARDLVAPCVPDGVPLTVIPLSSPPSEREVSIDDGGPPWIVSVGVVSSAKRVDDLLRAVAVAAGGAPLRLALVGDVDPDYASSLLRLADDLGLGDSVVVTGFVADSEYRRWMRAHR